MTFHRLTLQSWIVQIVLSSVFVYQSLSQTPCQKANCPNTTYCSETANGSTLCNLCDASCVGCFGPTANMCRECQVGYWKPAGQVQLCTPCADGFYGSNCSGECYCLNNELCNKTDGFCNGWKCDRGYTGLPYCRSLCSAESFGLDCQFLCHCPDGDNCSNVNGDCSSGRCHPDWGSAGCQMRLPKLATAPVLLDATCGNITVQWDAFSETRDIGSGPVAQYNLYLRPNTTDNDTQPWENVANISSQPDSLKYTYSITSGLLPDEEYNVRVDTVAMLFNKIMSQFSPGLMSDIVMNPCMTIPTTTARSTSNVAISRKVFADVFVTSLTTTSTTVSWFFLPEFAEYQYNVTIIYQLLGNGDCDSLGSSPQKVGPLPGNLTQYNLTSLLSWSTYRVTVSAVAWTAQLEESASFNVTTLASAPIGSVVSLNLTSLTSSEALLSWDPVQCSQRKGSLQFYDLRLTSADTSSSVPRNVSTPEIQFMFTNLTAFTNFSVQLRYTNTAGPGPWSQKFNFSTLEGVPGPVEILELVPTYSIITATFRPPSENNGFITAYTITFVSNTSVFNQSQSFTEESSGATPTITVNGLYPETLYFLKMAARTAAGYGDYGSVQQTRTLKAPVSLGPTTLQLLSKTNSCLEVKWNTSNMVSSYISTFVVEATKISAILSPPVIQNIPVSQNSTLVCQLRPSSLYNVSIYGKNSDNVIVTSSTEIFSTEHGTPPIPAVPVFVRSTYTTITITIEPVVSPDVPITSYLIQAELISGNKRKRFAGVPGYVTAELLPETLTRKIDFVIGDGILYNGYTNKELTRESFYNIYYVAVSTLNNDTTVSWSRVQAPVQTVPFDSTLTPSLYISLANKTMNCATLVWQLSREAENLTLAFTWTVKRAGDDLDVFVNTELPRTARSHEQCNLAPYTSYTLGVSARSSGGVLASASETVTTVHNTPSKPPPPVFVNATLTSITISIEPVVLTDAPLTAYQIQVEQVTSGRRKRLSTLPGYVTAQLSQADVTQIMMFVIGDELTYGGYVNKRLVGDTLYTIHYIVISDVAGDIKYSYSSLATPVRTVLPAAASDDTGVFIGVIVGLSLFILLVILLIFLYWWWRRAKKYQPYEIKTPDIVAKIPIHTDGYYPEKYWSNSFNLKDSRFIIEGRHLVYTAQPNINKPSPLHSNSPKISFLEEFQNLPSSTPKATFHLANRNRELNRFSHLLPFDHSLVRLKADHGSRSTYINASFISGYKKGPSYIAAQSPFDDKTTFHFWRLIFQKSIKTVVMLDNGLEEGVVKSCQYWPETSVQTFGQFVLTPVEVIKYADFIIRTVGLKHIGDDRSKLVKLFQFLSWPAHGVPKDSIPFLEMRDKVRRYHYDGPGPILVHCGTGMGRTAVFIAVDALIDQYATEGKINVFNIVKKMRHDRPYMVRTARQYVFIYEAVFEEFHAGDTLVGFDLRDRYSNWIQKNPLTRHSYLRDQLQLLADFSQGPPQDQYGSACLEINLKKNRHPDILAPEEFRPLLKSEGGLNPTDYINAVFLDSLFLKNHFIITQTPLHGTIIDFWKLVYDHHIHTIVMLEDFQNEDSTCAEYWPGMNLKLFEPFFIEMTAIFEKDDIATRSFSIRSIQHPKAPARLVRQFQLKAWNKESTTPPSKFVLLDLLDDVLAWQKESCQDERPVLVHCQDGASHCGLFAVLAILCEKMDEEEQMDVYRTIKQCKRRRPHVVAHYDQLKFCYQTLIEFIDTRMAASTFTDTAVSKTGKKKFSSRTTNKQSSSKLTKKQPNTRTINSQFKLPSVIIDATSDEDNI